MEQDTGPVPNALPADSPDADELIALIMSGTQPALAEPEHRFSAPPSTVTGSALWTSPPMESELLEPRVEPTVRRGAAPYTAPTKTPARDDAHAPPVVSVAESATPQPVEPIVAPQATPLVAVKPKPRASGRFTLRRKTSSDAASTPAPPAAPIAAAEAEPPSGYSLLTAAMQPYVPTGDPAAQPGESEEVRRI